MSFNVVVVFTSGYDFLFKSFPGHCYKTLNFFSRMIAPDVEVREQVVGEPLLLGGAVHQVIGGDTGQDLDRLSGTHCFRLILNTVFPHTVSSLEYFPPLNTYLVSAVKNS